MQINLPWFPCVEAIEKYVYLYNRFPHWTNNFESSIMLLDKILSLSIWNFHVFGCKIFAHILIETRASDSKLLKMAVQGIFVGYIGPSKIFCFYVWSIHVVQITRQENFSSHPVRGSNFWNSKNLLYSKPIIFSIRW